MTPKERPLSMPVIISALHSEPVYFMGSRLDEANFNYVNIIRSIC